MRRCLTGQVGYLKHRLREANTFIIEAARDADARPESRWVALELAQRAARILEEIRELEQLHERMVASGLSPHALAAPAIPLVLKSQPPPLMPIDVEPIAVDGGLVKRSA